MVNLQVSLALVHQSPSVPLASIPDPYGRTPFQHPALEGLENLNDDTRSTMTDIKRYEDLVERYSLGSVVRWKPKNVGYLSNKCS